MRWRSDDRWSRCRGLTLPEVLASLGIIVVLLGLILIVAGPAVAKSKTTPSCSQNLRQVAVALNLYVTDHDGGFPTRLLLGEGAALRSYGLTDKCPFGNIGYSEAFGDALAGERRLRRSGDSPTLTDPLNRPVPMFDPTKDVLLRCLSHSYDGFDALIGNFWNRSSPKSKGNLLAVRYDTSVKKAPVVSCWEFRYIPRQSIPFITSWRKCDRP